MDAQDKAKLLIEALPYLQAFDDKIVVVKLGGHAMHENELFTDTLIDIVFMEQVGIRPILVHGGGPQISERIKELGVSPRFIEGLRVTDEVTLKAVDEVFQEINRKIAEEINNHGGDACSIHGARDHILKAVKKILPHMPEVDLGHVGEVSGVNITKLLKMAQAGVVPVVSPLAMGEDGRFYNVNADTAAAKIAQGLKAEKLVFMTDTPGILRNAQDPTSLLTTLVPEQVEDLITDGVIQGGMLPKVEASLAAMRGGVNKVHIIDGRKHHSLLLEIFTPQGIGTQFINKDAP